MTAEHGVVLAVLIDPGAKTSRTEFKGHQPTLWATAVDR